MKLTRPWVSAAAALFSVSQLPTCLAWGGAGHEIVATIAQIYLHPTTLTHVCNILEPGSSLTGASPPCYISKIASWADQIKRQPQYRYSAPLHYIGSLDDHPSQSCAFPGARGWAGKRDGNVLAAIRNDTSILVDFTDGHYTQADAQDALKFLVHFLGDMHQPLHLTGRDRGGNSDKVLFDGRVTNLHSLWDGLLIAQALRTIPSNYTQPFPPNTTVVEIETHLRGAIYDPYVRRVMYEGMGVGSTPGRFDAEFRAWLSCPAPQSETMWDALQTIMGIRHAGDETRWDDDALCPFAWAKDLHRLNCDLVWPPELDQPPYGKQSRFAHGHGHAHAYEHQHQHEDVDMDEFFNRPRQPHPDYLELDTPKYSGRIRKEWVVEKLMAMAGVRLAGVLNGLFMDVEALSEDGCESLPLIPV